jgi:hypothetical protein
MLLCRIQLGERGTNSSTVLVWLEGQSEPFATEHGNVMYDPKHFAAERDWQAPSASQNAGPAADCYQTGSGWLHCQKVEQGRFGIHVGPKSGDMVDVSIPRLHELALDIRVPKHHLWDVATVRDRIPA